MKYPNNWIYERLYRRYLQRDPLELFQELPIYGKRVLDLCCGGGRLAFAADKEGANVWAVDEEYDMIPNQHDIDYVYDQTGHIPDVRFECDTIKNFLAKNSLIEDEDKFDIVCCQQGINYWFNETVSIMDFDITMSALVSRVIKDGGAFVFNTFNQRPSDIPTTKIYNFDGVEYVEISYCINGVVHHVQTAKNIPPHVTKFDWIEPESFSRELSYWFSSVEETRIENTSLWKCIK